MSFEYVKQYYFVPACVGMGVQVNGRSGVIVEDLGNHIGVQFDGEDFTTPCHPTWRCTYTGMKTIKQTVGE